MKRFIKSKIYLLPMAATLMFGGCIEEEFPTEVATSDQVYGSSSAVAGLVNGLSTMLISYNSYGSSDLSSWYVTQDWGYPNYIYLRDCLCEDFPIAPSTDYNYQGYFEGGTYLYETEYMYYYYYKFISTANNIIGLVDAGTDDATMRAYLGIAQAYRALLYMDISRMFEFKETGYQDIDAMAADAFDLTVPIVTESTTADESKSNPRVPFYTMYRFIYNDLMNASANIAGYVRSSKTDIDEDVVNGFLARFWLEVASRFEQNPEDLAAQLEHEGDADGYRALGITTAAECYRNAAGYADKVIEAGYTPVSESLWHDANTGFNTSNNAWIWELHYSSTEQISAYWNTLVGQLSSEAAWSMCTYANQYRCITASLYDGIPDADWRKTSWIDPADAGSTTVPAKYNSLLYDENSATVAASTNFSRLPEYSNLKFRPASGDIIDDQIGLLTSHPLMRVEEMYFIKIEATAHTDGVAAGCAALQGFINAYRYTDGSYTCRVSTIDEFTKEMMVQKRIEFWGEGIVYFDYKRLNLAVTRGYEGTNYPEAYRLNSLAGYTAPWMNFYIPEREFNYNSAIVINPDCSAYVQSHCLSD